MKKFSKRHWTRHEHKRNHVSRYSHDFTRIPIIVFSFFFNFSDRFILDPWPENLRTLYEFSSINLPIFELKAFEVSPLACNSNSTWIYQQISQISQDNTKNRKYQIKKKKNFRSRQFPLTFYSNARFELFFCFRGRKLRMLNKNELFSVQNKERTCDS